MFVAFSVGRSGYFYDVLCNSVGYGSKGGYPGEIGKAERKDSRNIVICIILATLIDE